MTQNVTSKTKSAEGNDRSSNQPLSFKVDDPPEKYPPLFQDVAQLVRDARASSQDAREIAAKVVPSHLKDFDLEALTPDELIAHQGDEDYELATASLTYNIGDQGKYLIDADLFVREIEVGYAVAAVWVTNALADDAERIAFWASRISYSDRMDMTVCVLTLNAESPYPPAETERREAMVCGSVQKVYWIGEGHPQDVRLTRFSDFSNDVAISRNSSLQL